MLQWRRQNPATNSQSQFVDGVLCQLCQQELGNERRTSEIITSPTKPQSSSGGACECAGVIWLIDRLIRAIEAALPMPLIDPVMAAANTLIQEAFRDFPEINSSDRVR